MSKMSDDNIQNLSFLEQNLSSLLMQKQTFQKQSFEIDNALAELKNHKEAYQVTGQIMIKKSNTDLQKDLASQKQILLTRLDAITKQEKILRTQLTDLQKQSMKNLNNKK